MLKKIYNGQINSVTAAAFLVAASSLISRLLGILRDRILAGQFGAGDTLDIYYAAFRIPDLIFNLLVLGALSAGFIPIFTRLIGNLKDEKSADREKAWQLAGNIVNILLIALTVICGLGAVFAPAITKFLTPGFSPEKQVLTVKLTRIMFLSPMFLGVSSILGGILESFKRFFVDSLSPIVYNIGIIIGALYFVPLWGIYGLAWGVVFGTFLHMSVQLPLVFKLGFKYRFKIDLKDRETRKIGKMMIPRTMSLAISQLNLVVITILASTLAAGSLSIFNFANNLQSFPIGIFGISYAIAVFPTLSAFAFDKRKLIGSFSKTLRQILFFIMPATVLLLTLRAQIIRVILGTGLFDWRATGLTIDTLGFFTLSLFAQAANPLLIRVFYARRNSKSPFYVGLATAALNVLLSVWLKKYLGVAGLALAFSIANIFNFITLWIILRLELGDMDETKILISTAKFSAASIACGLAVQLMKQAVWPFINMAKLWGVLSQGLAAGLGGLATYVVICYWLNSEEMFDFYSSIKRRLPMKKIKTYDSGEARGI